MTIQHVYNLYDATIETYVAQFLSTHDKQMKRECEALYQQAKALHEKNPLSSQSALYRYADSYQMIHTADFDDQTGIYTPCKVPVTICNFGVFATTENNANTSNGLTPDEEIYIDAINSSSSSS